MRIVVADDHSLMRDILRQYLEHLADAPEVSEAGSLPEVLAHGSDDPPPELILLDLQMPGMDGPRSIAEVRRQFPEVPVVVISATEEPRVIREVIQAGANGYIPKTTRGKSVVTALKLVLAGETYVPTTLLGELSSSSSGVGRASGGAAIASQGGGFDKLSEREAGVLRLLIAGNKNKEIARDLTLQEVTVKVHLRNIYRKIGATNRADAVRIAFQCGWQDAAKAAQS